MSKKAVHNVKPAGLVTAFVLSSAALFSAMALLITFSANIQLLAALVSFGVWAGILVLVWRTVHLHQHDQFGYANQVTLLRAVVVAVLAGLVPFATALNSPAWLWAIAIMATATLCFDGLDGYLARKSGLSSAFGARFDMETDAFLALVITLFIWQTGKVGAWVLGLGVMRYVFVSAAFFLPALRAQLYPSMRRKIVCVVQVGALCLMLCPWLSSMHASLVGGLALGCLVYSFTVDVLWLLRHNQESRPITADA